MIRNPAVAGQFYRGTKEALEKEVAPLVKKEAAKEDAIGVVSPHAGYLYSGAVAGATLSSIKPKKTYIIMGPNHTGFGEPFGLSAAQSWRTPLGEVKIDKALAEAIKKNSGYIKYDDLSHAHEHSIEVQLPFLQHLQGNDFKFVPIVISQGLLEAYRDIGKEIALAVKELKMEKDVAIIASSDMTHYESQKAAEKKDRAAIDAILALDEERLVDSISSLGITMCGYAPAAIMIAAAKLLGAKKARLVKYMTSGNATGDYTSVVGYAGIIIS